MFHRRKRGILDVPMNYPDLDERDGALSSLTVFTNMASGLFHPYILNYTINIMFLNHSTKVRHGVPCLKEKEKPKKLKILIEMLG